MKRHPRPAGAAILIALAVILAYASARAVEVQPGEAYRDIIKKNRMRIGVSKDYPPLNFNAGERGVEIEMARKLGEFLGVQIELVPLDVDSYTEAVEKREVDAVIAGFSRNLARARSIWFSEPYLSPTPGVLANSRSLPQTKFGDKFEQAPISTLWDLKRLPSFRFAVKKGSTYARILRENFPDMPQVTVSSNEEGLALLNRGEVDGFVHDSLYLEYLYANSAKLRNAYVLLKGGSLKEKICVGLPFGDTVLKNQVDAFILEILRLGYIDAWLEKYSAAK